MILKNNRKIMLMVLAVLLSLLIQPVQAATQGAITLTGDWLSAGHTFYLYKIADLKNNQLVSSNALYSSVVSSLSDDSDSWQEGVTKLKALIDRNKISASAMAYSQSGSVSFKALDLGLYLISGESFKSGTVTYTPASVLISVPTNTASDNYFVTAELKKTVEEEKNQETKKTDTETSENKKTDETSGNGDNSSQKNKKTTSKTDTESGQGDQTDHKNTNTTDKTTKASSAKTSKSVSTNSVAGIVKTGDATKIGIYVLLLILSAAVLIAGITKIRRKAKDHA